MEFLNLREDAVPKNVAVTVDFSGVSCPEPLLGAKKILDDLQPGQTMCVISDCSGAHDDLSAWCQYTGNVFVSATKEGNGKIAYLLRKSGGEQIQPIRHMTLDMRGVSCPGPILEAKKLLEAMKSGEVLHLVADCSAAVDDVSSWSRAPSIELLLALDMGRGVREFYLKKR